MPLRRPVTENVEVRYKIASLLLLVTTFFLLIGAAVEAREVSDLARRGQVADAEVVRGPGVRHRTIDVTFVTASGETVRAKTSSYHSDVDLHDDLRIVYDPERPDRVQEAGWGEDYVPTYLVAVCGVVTGALALGCTLRRWPRRLERPLLT